MTQLNGRTPFVSDQITEILNKAVLQPLPSDVFEQLSYDIEKQDGEKIYQLVKEEIKHYSFERNQELKFDDYYLILDSLQTRIAGFEYRLGDITDVNSQRALRSDISRLKTLIERVELVRENNQQQ